MDWLSFKTEIQRILIGVGLGYITKCHYPSPEEKTIGTVIGEIPVETGEPGYSRLGYRFYMGSEWQKHSTP